MPELILTPFDSPDGLPNLRICRDGKTVTLHSLSPEREAERVVSRFNPGLEWVLVAGAGMGYVPEYLLKKTRHRILIYEHGTEILEMARSRRDLSVIEHDPRVSWVTGEPEKILAFLDEKGIRELNFYIHRPYFQIFPEFYPTLEGMLAAYLSRKQINRATLRRFQKVWLKNILRNSAFYAGLPGIKDLRHSYRGKPAVIAGAGPSLGRSLDELSAMRDSVIVISTDTALSMLEARGIRPDFAVSVDPQDKNAYYLLYAPDRSVPLVMDAAASSLGFLKYRPGPVIVTDTAFPAYDCLAPFWGEKGRLAAGGSVSTTAFDLARFFGCDPIILIGQDLSFTAMQTHNTGNILEEQFYARVNRMHTYESYHARTLVMSDRIDASGIGGKKVRTDRKFLTFRDWFQREIRNTQARVINATASGILIEGAENMTLNDAARQCGFAGLKIDRSFTADQSRRPDNTPDLNESLAAIRKKIRALLPLAAAAVKAAQEMDNAYSPAKPAGSYGRHLDPMNRFDRSLMESLKNLGSLGRLVELTMQESIQGILDNASEKLSADLVKKWEKLYREAGEGLAYLERLITKRLAASGSNDQ